jgi:hypothetical protein
LRVFGLSLSTTRSAIGFLLNRLVMNSLVG